jgi:hypothetical protein
MADDRDPVPPRTSTVGGRFVEVIGWLIVALAVGLVILQIVQGTLSIAGVVLALFLAVAGVATVGTGRSITRSR